jgi:hypothetical protein
VQIPFRVGYIVSKAHDGFCGQECINKHIFDRPSLEEW